MNSGELIRKERKAKKLTQKELGDLCGMADSAIRRYESGRGNPTIATLRRIAAALNVDLFNLIPEHNKSGFEDIPEYFSDEDDEIREKAHEVEETLMRNALNEELYFKLLDISDAEDSAVIAKLKEFDINEDTLKSVLLGSFDMLNLCGKREAVELVAELEQNPRFSKWKKGHSQERPKDK